MPIVVIPENSPSNKPIQGRVELPRLHNSATAASVRHLLPEQREVRKACSLKAESQNDSKKQEYTRHREFHGDSYAWSKKELSRGTGGIDEGH